MPSPMVTAVLFVIAQRQETQADEHDKDDHYGFAHRLGDCLRQGAIIERHMEHRSDHKEPTEPLVAPLDKPGMDTKKEENPGQGGEEKGACDQWRHPVSRKRYGWMVLVLIGAVVVHRQFC